jgi:hypothetical protein
MLTTDRQSAVMQQPNAASGIASGTNTWATGPVSSCPDDCHYCSGPETD